LTCDKGKKWERGRGGVYIPAELHSNQGISSPFTASVPARFGIRQSPFSSPTRVSHRTIHSSQSWSFSEQKGPIDPLTPHPAALSPSRPCTNKRSFDCPSIIPCCPHSSPPIATPACVAAPPDPKFDQSTSYCSNSYQVSVY
jgi:hypothetical protein